MFPDAPLYTLVYQKGSTSPLIENRKIKASFLNYIPGIDKHYPKLEKSKPQKNPISDDKSSFTVFVEGKADEYQITFDFKKYYS
jgi:hypothetical protein